MKKIFVTGATGFIGSNVLKQANHLGIKVKALRRNSKSLPSIKLIKQPQWITKELNNLNIEDLNDSDAIVHLAACGVSPQKASLEEMLDTNVHGTINLLKLASKADISRVIVAGTCHEYGYSKNLKGSTSPKSPLFPRTEYAASKVAQYAVSIALAKKLKLELCYLRLYSVYGDGQYEKNFWPSLKKAALNGEDFEMTSGEQRRDFIHVDKVSKSILEACFTNNLEIGKPNVTDLGTGNPSKLIDFANREWAKFEAKGNLKPGLIKKRESDSYDSYTDCNEEIVI